MLTIDYGVAQAHALRGWLTRTIAQIRAGDLRPPDHAALFPEA